LSISVSTRKDYKKNTVPAVCLTCEMYAAGEACHHDLGQRVQGFALGRVEEDRLRVAEILATNGLDKCLGDELHDELPRPVVRFHLKLPVLLLRNQLFIMLQSTTPGRDQPSLIAFLS
jgi:hypothetical protein